jgi:hypothetical protein
METASTNRRADGAIVATRIFHYLLLPYWESAPKVGGCFGLSNGFYLRDANHNTTFWSENIDCLQFVVAL